MLAEGDLYLDDGDSLDTVETGSYSRVNFRANHSTKTGAGAMTAQVRLPSLNFTSTFAPCYTALGSWEGFVENQFFPFHLLNKSD